MKRNIEVGTVRKAKLVGRVVDVKILATATPKTYDVRILESVVGFFDKNSKATIHESDFV